MKKKRRKKKKKWMMKRKWKRFKKEWKNKEEKPCNNIRRFSSSKTGLVKPKKREINCKRKKNNDFKICVGKDKNIYIAAWCKCNFNFFVKKKKQKKKNSVKKVFFFAVFCFLLQRSFRIKRRDIRRNRKTIGWERNRKYCRQKNRSSQLENETTVYWCVYFLKYSINKTL